MDRMAPEKLAAGSCCWTRYCIARILLDKDDGDPAPYVIVVTTSDSEFSRYSSGFMVVLIVASSYLHWKPAMRQTNIKQQQDF